MIAVNWDQPETYTSIYWKQNIQQFWQETEFKVSKDVGSWNKLSPEEQDVYKKVLSGLTGLDTHQADEGMPLILLHTEDLQKKAVLSFMGMMEQIHAKSYSHIFTTLISSEETKYLLEDWVVNEPHLIKKADLISSYYYKLLKPEVTTKELYQAHVASVLLESFLFYSGFFYPVYLSGQGKMTTSGEIIRKIILDETIHGSFVGLLAQQLRETLSEEEKAEVDREMYSLIDELYENEVSYTRSIYDQIGLTDEVIEYLKYNGNRAVQNLGFDLYYEHAPINPIVENGINTDTKNHDFFSQKGDSYVVGLNVEDMQDDDFNFDDVMSKEQRELEESRTGVITNIGQVDY